MHNHSLPLTTDLFPAILHIDAPLPTSQLCNHLGVHLHDKDILKMEKFFLRVCVCVLVLCRHNNVVKTFPVHTDQQK